MIKKFLLIMQIIFLFATVSFSQTGQTGAIKGTVTLPMLTSGEALPGVVVTIRSPAMVLEKMATVTNEKGQYRFMNLPPGIYELRFELDGFNTVVRKKIVVNANLTFTVNVQMEQKKITEVITVIGESPTIDRQSVTKTTTLNNEFLDSIPATRDLMVYFNMTPGITGDSAQGAAVRDNSYNLDGIKMNDPVVGSSGGNMFSMDIMEEISVQTGGLSAEHGSVKGAVLNVITKSGGNNFSGTISGYYNHEDFQSDNTKGTPLEGSLSGPRFEMEPGITLGGPLVKDKIWFFLNMSTYRSETYIAGFPHDQTTEVPIKDNTIYPYLKLTIQPTQVDKFVLGFNYSKRTRDNRDASKYETVDTTWDERRPTYVLSAVWTHNYGDNFITNLKFGAYSTDFNLYAKKEVGWVREDTTYLATGSYGFTDLNPRKRFQMNLDGTLFLDDVAGSHEVKFGFQGNLLQGRRKVIPYGPPDSLGMARLYSYLWNGVPYYACWGGGHDRLVRSLNAGVFVNDTWNISNRLTLNLGLRFDFNRNYFPAQDGSIGDVPSQGSYAHIGAPDQTYDLVIDSRINAFEWKNISPRIGMVIDLFGDNTTFLKANFSRYLQDNYTTVSFELHPVNWLWYEGYTDAQGNLSDLTYTFVPGVDTKVGYKGQGLKTPNTWEFSIGIERELWEDWSMGVRYIRRIDKDMIETVDATVVDIEALMDQEEVIFTDRWKKVEVTNPYDNKTVTFYEQLYWTPRDNYMVNPPDLERKYEAVEFTFKKRFSKGWQFNMSYTYNTAKGTLGTSFWQSEGRTSLYDNPNAHVNAYGYVDLARKHQFKLNCIVRGPFGINISGYLRYLSGRPYTQTVSSFDLGLNFRETVFAEPRGSRTLPNLILIDLRLEKEFRIGKNFNFKIFGDVFNLLNDNKATAVVTTSSSPTLIFEEMTAIQDPRVFRLGAKIEFDL